MKKNLPLLCAALLASSLSLSAVNRTWDGEAGDNNFATALNWSGNTAPANNDYGDIAVFGASTSAGTINNPASRNINGITFESAGWTLTGSNLTTLSKLSSAGAGTNTMEVSFELRYSAAWNVSIGNTLVLAESFYQRANNVNLTGGGTLVIGSAITGYTGTVGSWGLNINDGTTVRFNSASVYYNSAGAIFINDTAARLQLLTSVSGAEALIGTRVRDNTGLGLIVTDIGGGYVEIAAIPEPSAFAFLSSVAVLGLVISRRARPRNV